MRVFLDKGYLVQTSTLEDSAGNEYEVSLEFQVFAEDGSPSSRSYRGEGLVDGTRILLGDPYRDTHLLEGKVERQATSESWHYYQGFKAALSDRQQAIPWKLAKKNASYAGNPTRWWDGYAQGWQEKRERKAHHHRVKGKHRP